MNAEPAKIRSLVLGEHLVHVAIKPPLLGLGGSDHGVAAGVRMLAGVPVRRRIATQCDAACLTCSEMYPPIAGLHACLAFADARRLHGVNLKDVTAQFGSHVSRGSNSLAVPGKPDSSSGSGSEPIDQLMEP